MPRRNSAACVFQHINTHNNNPNVCWEWMKQTKGGGRDNRPYYTVGGKKLLAYRIVYEIVHGPIPDGQVVRHKCDNGRCCNPYHLELGSHQENMNDMKQRERHGLPHHTVRRIKKLLASGRTQKEIAELFGLSRETVRDINTGVTYSHVTLENSDEIE